MQWKKKQSDRLTEMSLDSVGDNSGKMVAKVPDTGYVGVPPSDFGTSSGAGSYEPLTSAKVAQMETDDVNAYTGKAVAQYVTEHSLTIPVDDAMSTSSTNPVQNKVVTQAINSVSDIASIGVTANARLDAIVPTAATFENKLADKAYVDFGVEQVAARYLSADAKGNPFESYEAFNAGVFYYNTDTTTPTKNDYVLVNGDETRKNAVTRYWFTGETWSFQYVVNTSPLNDEQLAAINSGINAGRVESYDNHLDNTDIHVTSGDKSTWDGKQDRMTDAQQAAADSGITSTKVAAYDSHRENADIHVSAEQKLEWDSKQDGLTAQQLASVNSGISSSKVASIDNHLADADIHVTSSEKSTWDGKYDKPSGGIPLSDLATSVQASLGKADTAVQSSALSSYVKKAGDSMSGQLTVSAAGGDPSSSITGPIVGKITNAANKTGLNTNGSGFFGDFGSGNSQFVGIRRQVSGKKIAARFQVYATGLAAFMQVDYTNTAKAYITALFQYGWNPSTNEFEWGSMERQSNGVVVETKHFAFKEDLPVDSAMSLTSVNPVQNKVVNQAIGDAISDAIKGYTEISGMNTDDAHAYTGKAIVEYVSSAIGGNVGGYLGVLDNAQVTAKDDWKSSDWFVAKEKGTNVAYTTNVAHTISYEAGDEIYLQSNNELSVKPTTVYEKTNNKVAAIDDSNMHYPTTGAVKDFVEDQISGLSATYYNKTETDNAITEQIETLDAEVTGVSTNVDVNVNQSNGKVTGVIVTDRTQAKFDTVNSNIENLQSSITTGLAGKQDALTAQTAYSEKGNAMKVPQITTNALGQVTAITEVAIDYPDYSREIAQLFEGLTGKLNRTDVVQTLDFDKEDPASVELAKGFVPSQYAVGEGIDNSFLRVQRYVYDNYVPRDEFKDNFDTENAKYDITIKRYVNEYFLDKEDPAVGVVDWGNSEYKVLCGYKGGSITAVAPGLNPGEPKSSGSEYLISVFHNDTAKTSYYKDVKAENVTVGKALADGAGNNIASTYETATHAWTTFATSLPRDIHSSSGLANGCYMAPSVLCVWDGVNVKSTSISAIIRDVCTAEFRAQAGMSYKILNVFSSSITITGFAANKTWTLPPNTFMTTVYWNGNYYREDT